MVQTEQDPMIRRLFIGTLLSILVFFAVSFLSILGQIAGPMNGHAPRIRLDVGWPFKFYEEFWLSGSTSANCGWDIKNLLLGCALTWVLVTSAYFIITSGKVLRN